MGGALIAFDQPYISNPNLLDPLKHDRNLASCDLVTFHSTDAVDYVNYQSFERSPKRTKRTGSRTIIEERLR